MASKIEADALTSVRAKGRITAVVRMAAGSEVNVDGAHPLSLSLRPHSQPKTRTANLPRAERAQALHDQKVALANSAQSALLEVLSARGISHKSMWVDNSVIVHDADEALLQELAARDDVGSILGEGQVQLH